MRYRLYLPNLPTTPWLDPALFDFVPTLENGYADVAAELQAFMDQQPKLEPFDPNPDGTARHPIGWRQYTLRPGDPNFPRSTNNLYKLMPSFGPTGDPFLSVLEPKTVLKEHTDPSNYFVTAHLGLKIPEACGLSAAGERRRWQTGKVIFFDPSFMHGAWNDSDELRIVLLFRTWHPGVTQLEKRVLTDLARVIAPAVDQARDTDMATRESA
jgi:aspartyl/asparaginyl beta-hydroxylase (cupin superfamily)